MDVRKRAGARQILGFVEFNENVKIFHTAQLRPIVYVNP
jgi:hypothetical protein